MKNAINNRLAKGGQGFTLIELLVVIGVIALLAAMLLTISPSITFKSRISAVKGQMMQMQAAIESYHAKYNTYPPDAYKSTAPFNPAITPLYYELVGTTNVVPAGGSSTVYYDYVAEPGGAVATIDCKAVSDFHGHGGFLNSAQDGIKPQNFIGKVPKVVNYGTVKLLAAASDLPSPIDPQIPNPDRNNLSVLPATKNVWMYSASNPLHNKTSYDLWTWVVYGDRRQLIANWKN